MSAVTLPSYPRGAPVVVLDTSEESTGCAGTRLKVGDTATVTSGSGGHPKGWCVVAGETTDYTGPTWSELPAAALALDITDPAGMDIAARWLARVVGLTLGHTAPEWVYYADPVGPWWRIRGAGGEVVFFASEAYPWTARTTAGARLVIVPGISALTNPAEALALACLAVGGGT